MKRNKIVFIVFVVFAAAFIAGGISGVLYVSSRPRMQDVMYGAAQQSYNDGLEEGYEGGYHDGYEAGYTDGHREAQQHSGAYNDLLLQSWEATAGKGVGFCTDADGNPMFEETAPNGQKVRVYLVP